MNSLQTFNQTLESREVAEMINKEHRFLLRDIRRYVTQFNQCNIAPVNFFQEGTYKDSKGEIRPCYLITLRGCEFIAHKLTGIKGTEFTVRYINRFHEMQDKLSNQKIELPWFIKEFRGKQIMLFRDFKTITGVEISGNYTSHKRWNGLTGGLDYNGWGWRCDNEEFRQEYGFDYGDDPCMMYLYLCGISKALNIYAEEKRNRNNESYKIILDGLNRIEKQRDRQVEISKPVVITGDKMKGYPVQINIIMNGNMKVV